MGKKLNKMNFLIDLCHINLKNKGILLSSKPVSATTPFLQEKWKGTAGLVLASSDYHVSGSSVKGLCIIVTNIPDSFHGILCSCFWAVRVSNHWFQDSSSHTLLSKWKPTTGLITCKRVSKLHYEYKSIAYAVNMDKKSILRDICLDSFTLLVHHYERPASFPYLNDNRMLQLVKHVCAFQKQ